MLHMFPDEVGQREREFVRKVSFCGTDTFHNMISLLPIK